MIENISLKEALKDAEKYNEYLNLAKYLNPKNVLNCEPIQKKEWGKIKEYQYLLSKHEFTDSDWMEFFKYFTGHDLNTDIMVIDFFYQIKWIVSELEKLSEKEQSVLSSELTPEQIEAGYEDLGKFGYKATTHALAGKDILKHEFVEALPYEKVFLVLYMEKVSNEINEKHWKILNKK